jgi:DNA (cytosine-5)-methyltransferase 1
MSRAKTVKVVDLFAGAGGTSQACVQACESLGLKLKLTAINHWDVAVETHAANHPDAVHVCETLDSVDPRKLVKGQLDILCASPECTHHSNARGGKPCDDQSRATAMHVIRWAEALRPSAIIVENVREMLSWGPLGSNGRPLKSKKGVIFNAWVNMLEACGYHVSHRLVNAADFGGATTRTRLFILAVRGRRQVPWAQQSHERTPTETLFGSLPRWRPASEVIDWTLPGKSIFGRKRPLAENTIRRIAEGMRRFWKIDPEPFLVRLRGTSESHLNSSALPINDPLPTLTAGRNIGLCEPFIVPQFGSNRARSIDRPLGGITTTSRGMGICEPFIIGTGQPNARGSYVYDSSRPLPTVTSADDHAIVQPFLMTTTHHGSDASRVKSLSEPVPTITGAHRGEHALVSPFIVPTNYGEREGQTPRTHEIGSPLPTIVGSDTHGLIEPFLVNYNGTGGAHSLGEPLPTQTTRDRFGIVMPSGHVLVDVFFRMLQPHELALGMGFPPGYVFKGIREDVVRQIGNAVEVNKARAHLSELLQLVA